MASELGAAVPRAAVAERTGGWRKPGLLARDSAVRTRDSSRPRCSSEYSASAARLTCSSPDSSRHSLPSGSRQQAPARVRHRGGPVRRGVPADRRLDHHAHRRWTSLRGWIGRHAGADRGGGRRGAAAVESPRHDRRRACVRVLGGFDNDRACARPGDRWRRDGGHPRRRARGARTRAGRARIPPAVTRPDARLAGRDSADRCIRAARELEHLCAACAFQVAPVRAGW